MAEYISRDEAIERLKIFGAEHNALAVIRGIQAADVVPVQRCDGCKFADWHSNGCIAYCTKHGTDGHVADSYCSEGEKDGEHDG